ncbi:phosphatidylinositol-glycan biosynthesis class S protein, partial [Cladochytrium replicatum]
RRMAIVASIAAVFVAALPMWWQTTAVYRAPLPLSSIQKWSEPTRLTSYSLYTVQLDFENMRVMKYSNEYQIAFSLLNGDPTDVVVSWDAKAALDAYVNPLLERLGDIYTFHLNSQVQNYATLPVTPDREVGSDGSVKYTLSAHSLSTFINSAEWNMVASTVSHAPPLNFVLYVPPRILTPLHLKRADGTLLESNAFLVHRWGGIVISNTPNTVSTPGTTESPEFHYTVSELQGPLSYFVAQLRTLCGVKPTRIRKASSLLPGVSITYDTSRDGITSWEYDRLLRFRVAAILRDAAGTLQSLATLVTSMPNMVVLDAIRDRVSDALDDMDDAREALNVGNETEALKRARSALKGAEDAFFDPTMVSLLYFPDEHKYAVYLPLFFPISVPLILALLDATKRTQGQRRWWRRQQ